MSQWYFMFATHLSRCAALDKQASKYRQRAKAHQSVNMQRGRPSWAQQTGPARRHSDATSAANTNGKRKHVDDAGPSSEVSEDKKAKLEA